MGNDDLNSLWSIVRNYREYDYANPIYNEDGSISYNYTTKRYPSDVAPGDLPLAGSYDMFNGYGRKLYYELAVNYARSFGDHSVSGLLLFNRKMNETTTTNVITKQTFLPFFLDGQLSII